MNKELMWRLIGDIQEDWIVEAAMEPIQYKLKLNIRKVLLIAALAVMLTLTAVAVCQEFGWLNIFGPHQEAVTETAFPIAVSDSHDGTCFTIDSAVADDRVLYLLWEISSTHEVFSQDTKIDATLDFGNAGINSGGGFRFTYEPITEQSRLIGGYVVADWDDAMQKRKAHICLQKEAEAWDVEFPVKKTLASISLDNCAKDAQIQCSQLSIQVVLGKSWVSSAPTIQVYSGEKELALVECRKTKNNMGTTFVAVFKTPVDIDSITTIKCGDYDLLNPSTEFGESMISTLPESIGNKSEIINDQISFGGVAFPTYDKAWSFEEIFDNSYSKPLAECKDIEWYPNGGLKFPADCIGLDIYAMKAGTVIEAAKYGWNMGYGRYIVIAQEDGQMVLYCHCDTILVNVGDEIAQGEVIGTAGNSGRTENVCVYVLFSQSK